MPVTAHASEAAHPPITGPTPTTLAPPAPPHTAAHGKHVTKLSTLSPEAIRVAAEILPLRLANLLIRKGPLAIRLITLHLSSEVPGFELLLLSKQRRLIMAAMEQGDPVNNVVFEKIGWGQWAVRHVDLDYIVARPDTLDGLLRMNIHELKEKAKLGWLKKADHPQPTTSPKSAAAAFRRDSILANKPDLHKVRLPDEGMDALSSSSEQDSDDDMDGAMDDDMDPDADGPVVLDMLKKHDSAIADDDDELFRFDDDVRAKRLPPIKLAGRVPTKFSPPPGRRKSLSSVVKNTLVRHQLFSRLRLNLIENLDDYILLSARNLALLVTSLPLGLWTGEPFSPDFGVSPELIAQALGRRKLLFNELSIRLTLSLSLPRRPERRKEPQSDTDEEDWATMGAASLRQNLSGVSSPAMPSEERAARALVNLMGN